MEINHSSSQNYEGLQIPNTIHYVQLKSCYDTTLCKINSCEDCQITQGVQCVVLRDDLEGWAGVGRGSGRRRYMYNYG